MMSYPDEIPLLIIAMKRNYSDITPKNLPPTSELTSNHSARNPPNIADPPPSTENTNLPEFILHLPEHLPIGGTVLYFTVWMSVF